MEKARNATFEEYFITGYSSESGIRATKIITVKIVEDELWIYSPLLFAGILDFYGMIYKIKLQEIHKLYEKKIRL